jgi:hypothetical protein
VRLVARGSLPHLEEPAAAGPRLPPAPLAGPPYLREIRLAIAYAAAASPMIALLGCSDEIS